MKRKILSFMLLACMATGAFAARLDTVMTYSKAMNKEIPAIVITPDSYTSKKDYSVVYMLHGFGGSYKNDWASPKWDVVKYADVYDIIIVTPDGSDSWYLDSPIDPSYRYETYISQELVAFVDTHYSTRATREGRAITGLSMGGHGALHTAFLHQDVFGACGSMSGGVDIRPFPNNWHMSKTLGTYAEHPENWERHTVINLTHLLTPGSLAIIFDCGTDDFFYEVNCRLHEKLEYMNIPHDFTSRPGAHTAEYWRNSIKYHLVFFDNYFNSKKEEGK